jgi:hypothetical protein
MKEANFSYDDKKEFEALNKKDRILSKEEALKLPIMDMERIGMLNPGLYQLKSSTVEDQIKASKDKERFHILLYKIAEDNSLHLEHCKILK